ncbi:hypothetical protein [Paracraurococcus lichenis]|uniref:GIY-YIG nuclease family protein n=1 Tax=Paracraurococcus lichenis TaxID=3064888 RepID=A0ABT9EAM1_9PROT|nr:hypothetical protein [Paracraurococcus sp. LOR1-02]MDO9713033.1 hypothetical protein [Paracraurococcus sp. LOR1-02]
MFTLSHGYVLLHPDRGIYVGRSAEQTYWSKIGAAGRNVVATFRSRAEAVVHLDAWLGLRLDPEELSEFTCHYVLIDVPGGWASCWALRVAGLEEHIGELAHPCWDNPMGQC